MRPAMVWEKVSVRAFVFYSLRMSKGTRILRDPDLIFCADCWGAPDPASLDKAATTGVAKCGRCGDPIRLTELQKLKLK